MIMKTLIFILLAILNISAFAQTPFGTLQQEQKFKDYTVRIYRDEDDSSRNVGMGCLVILKSNKQVYFRPGVKFDFGDIFDEENTNNLPRVGQSITTDHEPNLVISEWSGGAHCCFTYHVFQIGDQFKFLGSVEGVNSGVNFKDVNRNGDLRLAIYDWTFEYWHTGFSDSPSPEVILRYQNGKYAPDLELMKKPAPTQQTLKSKAKEIEKAFGEVVSDPEQPFSAPSLLWGEMLDLIYSGNMKSAWALLDLSWPDDKPGKAKFKKAFMKQLSTSPYYRYITLKGFQI